MKKDVVEDIAVVVVEDIAVVVDVVIVAVVDADIVVVDIDLIEVLDMVEDLAAVVHTTGGLDTDTFI